MPRAPRLHESGGTVHVVARCNNRELSFTAPEDFERVLTALRGMLRTYEVPLDGDTLMSNHVHLLLQAGLRLVRGPTMRLAWVRGPPFDAGVTLGAGREVQRSGKRGPPW